MTKKTKSRRKRNAHRQVHSNSQSGYRPVFREAPIAQAAPLAVADHAQGQWDVLNDMYLKMRALMDHWVKRAAPVLTDPVLLAQLDDKVDYCALLVQFRCDMEQLARELVGLHEAHAGKTGGTEDPDENLFAAMLFEQYVMWQLRHDQTLIPIVNHLLEYTHEAELTLAGARPSTLATQAGFVEVATNAVASDQDESASDVQVVEAEVPRPEE